MLSYKGRDFIINDKKPTEENVQEPNKPQLKIERILIPDIGYYMKLYKVNKLDQIPPMFCYYENPDDKVNKPGLYCSIIPGVQIRIPFPTIIDSTKEYGRGSSIRCKYKSKDTCNEQRNKMAKYHNSGIRLCNFAHTGEKIIKIGYPSRCSIIPRFGDCSTLINDIKTVKMPDIKNILLYGLNDIATSAIWLDCNKISNVVYNDIEYA
jgi:hypothetical protein